MEEIGDFMSIAKENLTICDAVIADAAKLGAWWCDEEIMAAISTLAAALFLRKTRQW